MVLRINKIDIEEDEGIWKCQIFVNDERNKGRLKLEGESRKRIAADNIRTTHSKSSEFRRRGRRTQQNDLNEESWYLKQSVEEEAQNGERTFGFSKNDGIYAVFERSSKQSSLFQSSLLPNIYDNTYKIEYIRNTKKLSKNKENTWKRHLRTTTLTNNGAVQLGLKFSKKIILIFIMLKYCLF
uniref:Uncharacterized protein n=1 Tax=Meloidogyne incognita TaxID=6306 RepID=A0A914LM55_MELIC